jgi:hypothetical protein
VPSLIIESGRQYVVVNSGLTADWQDWAGTIPPQHGILPFFGEKGRRRGIALAGVFNES